MKMSQGTWVLAHRGKPTCALDGRVLKLEAYTEAQVEELLSGFKFDNQMARMDIAKRRVSAQSLRMDEHVLELYRSCSYKPVISSFGLIEAFRMMTRTVADFTECKFASQYVIEQVKQSRSSDINDQAVLKLPEVMKLGEITFTAEIAGKSVYTEQDLIPNVPRELWEKFLERGLPMRKQNIKVDNDEGNTHALAYYHAIAKDFLMANYVALNPDLACWQWLQKAKQFNRVFLFVCSIWSEQEELPRDKRCHIQRFLDAVLVRSLTDNEVKSMKKKYQKDKGKSHYGDGDNSYRRRSADVGRSKQEESKHPHSKHSPDASEKKGKTSTDNASAMEAGKMRERDKNDSKQSFDNKSEKKEENRKAEAMDVDAEKDKTSEDSVEPQFQDSSAKKEKQKAKRPRDPETRSQAKGTIHKVKNWGFILDVYEACDCRRQIRYLLAGILEGFSQWLFPASLSLSQEQLKHLDIILKEVKPRRILQIELESGSDLVGLFAALKNIKGKKDARIEILVNNDITASPVNHEKSLKLCNTIMCGPNTVMSGPESNVYITYYCGSFICPDICQDPQFFKCSYMSKLKELDINVNDMASLRQVFCKLPESLKSLRVTVDLKVAEQSFLKAKNLCIPKVDYVHVVVKYFDNLQNLLQSFDNPEHLKYLSIHDLKARHNFEIHHFSNLISLNFRYQQGVIESENQENTMDVEVPDTSHIMDLCILLLPQNLQRLLLRNANFYRDNNQYFLLQFWKKHANLKRLVVLDCLLTLNGVRKLVMPEDDTQRDPLIKKGRAGRFEVAELKQLVEKKLRLSKAERTERQMNKPAGKEVVIWSETALCGPCGSFPCLCPTVTDTKDTLDTVSGLIEDIYTYDILTFSYTSHICSVKKNVNGDLNVECVVSELNEDAADVLSAPGSSPLHTLFLCLTLAQSVTLKGTSLNPSGVAKIVHHLCRLKQNQAHGVNKTEGSATATGTNNMETTSNVDAESIMETESSLESESCTKVEHQSEAERQYEGVEPFNLTIVTNWSSPTELVASLTPLAELVMHLECLSVFTLKLGGQNESTRFKKTFKKMLMLNERPFDKNKMYCRKTW